MSHHPGDTLTLGLASGAGCTVIIIPRFPRWLRRCIERFGKLTVALAEMHPKPSVSFFLRVPLRLSAFVAEFQNTSRFPIPQSPCETLEGFPNPQSPRETLEGFREPSGRSCKTFRRLERWP